MEFIHAVWKIRHALPVSSRALAPAGPGGRVSAHHCHGVHGEGGSWQFLEPEIGTVTSLSRQWESVVKPAREAKAESDDVLVCFPESGDVQDAFADLIEGGATRLPA
ncbi:hypothetical protein RI056_04705 [Komagataeibacter nataicola]|nr:hypothetical protein RI056_04705 [Komagataeibacter nataicola]